MSYLFSNHSFSPPSFHNGFAPPNIEDHYESWKHKLIDYWTSHDTLFWLLSELCKLQVQNPASLRLEQFVYTRGYDLKRLSKDDFCKIIPQYGEILYNQLQMKLQSTMNKAWPRSGETHDPGVSSPMAPEHFNMVYFDQPHPRLSMPSTSTLDSNPKSWLPHRQEYEYWTQKRLLEWTPRDTLDCLAYELVQMNINPSSVNLECFREVYGCDLAKMTLEDFKWFLPNYGELLYLRMQPKIRYNLESEMPWRITYDSQVISRPNLSQPTSYAHSQELSYAHPSCFRWKSERIFAGSSSDDSVLNLSRERRETSTSEHDSSGSALLERRDETSSHFSQPSTFSSSQSSTLKRDFSILSLSKNSSTCEDRDTTRDQVSDHPLKIDFSDPVIKCTKDYEMSPKNFPDKDLDSQGSWMPDNNVKTQDSQKDSVLSAADVTSDKGLGSYIENSVMDHGYNSETNDEFSDDKEKDIKKKEKRKPGRPKSLFKKDKSKGKVGRVWEFIRDLIMDPKYNPSVISWEDREKGQFRFRSGDQVAKLWGCKRGNPRMNFENFSRSIRQNYKKGYLLPVEKIRLVYQFGPHSTGWRIGDPPPPPLNLPSHISNSTSADNVAAAQ